MSDLTFNPIFESYILIIAIGLLLIALVAVDVWRRRVSKRRAWVLASLRLVTILVIVVILLRPSRTTFEVLKKPTTLVILIDTSRSMLVPDMLNTNRWKYLVNLLKKRHQELADLAENIEIKVYTFDNTTRPVVIKDGKIELPNLPTGEQTAMGDALNDILSLEGRKQLIGVILITDGAERTNVKRENPERIAGRLRRQRFPLYTLAIGEESAGIHQIDIDLSNLMAGPTVFVKNELNIRADIRTRGLANQLLDIEVLVGRDDKSMKVVHREQKKVPPGSNASLVFNSKYIPEKSGEFKLTVRIAEKSGELITTNNQQSTYFTVLEGGIKVLYVDFDIRPEQNGLRWALASSPDINLDFIQFFKRDREQWPVRLEEQLKIGKYDVYIIGNLDSDAFKLKGTTDILNRTEEQRNEVYPQLAQLVKVIRDGAGLIMIGGEHSFTAGGYGFTPLAEVLPIEMKESHIRQRVGEDSLLEDFHLKGPLKILPVKRKDINFTHYLMELTGAASLSKFKNNEQRWDQLTPLDGANKLVQDGGLLLAETADREPLLIAKAVSEGRTLVFAGDSTNRWRRPNSDGNIHSDALKLFWRQIILWLAHLDESDQSNVWVKLPARRYRQSQPVRFIGGARRKNGEKAVNAKFKAKVELPNGKTRAIALIPQGNQVAGTILDNDLPGDYRIVIEATENGVPLGTGYSRFIVEKRDLELANAGADKLLLKRMAHATESVGGRSVAPEKLAELLKELKEKPKELEVTVPRTIIFGNRPEEAWLLLLIVAILLGVEWYLRKAWRLV